MKTQEAGIETIPVQESCITDEELGACAFCPGYRFLKPHKRRDDGKIEIRCFPVNGPVAVRTDIQFYQDCESYKSFCPIS